MFIRDGEQLNLSKKDLNKTEQWIKSTLQEINRSNKMYVFKAKMKPVRLEDSNGGIHVDHRYVSVPTEVLFSNPKTSLTENWQLLTNSGGFKKRADGTIDVQREPGIRISTEGLYLDSSKDAEKIFYLKHISVGQYGKYLYLEDKAAEAKKLDEELMMQDMAFNIISDPKSIISENITGSTDAMKQLAVAWGVVSADSLTYSELKLNLRKALIKSQNDFVKTRRGFREFINEANRIGDSEKRSTILLGIERNILVFEDNMWSLRTREGGLQMLRTIPPGQESSKDDWIIRFLVAKENDAFYELLEGLIKNPITIKPRVNNIKDQPKSRADMIRECKGNLGWPHKMVFGKKNEELEQIISDQLKYTE
jgi:hypothetical protein